MKRAICLVALVGCTTTSTIGPFVKTITRTADTLAIVSCEILLQGDYLVEGRCYSQVVPLAGAPRPVEGGPGAIPSRPSAPTR
jgi:hypothetical protein